MKRTAKPKPKALTSTSRIPTVEECEKCEYQKDCDAGRLCKRGKPDKDGEHYENRNN